MAELSDTSPAPPTSGEAPEPVPGAADAKGPPKVRRTRSPNGKRKRRKDLRRRPKVGGKAAATPALTPLHMETLRDALRNAWTPYAAKKHFAPLWQIDESTVQRGIDALLAEMTKAREAIPAEQRAASVVEGMHAFLRKVYDAFTETGDPKVLSGAPNVLAQLARIEGVAQPVKVEHSGNVTSALTLGEMPADKVKARIAELVAKHLTQPKAGGPKQT